MIDADSMAEANRSMAKSVSMRVPVGIQLNFSKATGCGAIKVHIFITLP